LARRWLGTSLAQDELIAEQLLDRVAATLRPDGSVAGAALPTFTALIEAADLDRRHPVVPRLLGWTYALRGKPGAFNEGCTAARHPRRTCEHFLGGFFSPGPLTVRMAPLTFPNGVSFRVEAHARFALSCLALRAVLAAGGERDPLVERHLDSFAHLIPEFGAWSDSLPPDLALVALSALAYAPHRQGDTVEQLVRMIAARQLSDGSWPRADFFHALDALSLIDHPESRPILERALPALLVRQRDDGSFGSAAQEERALIGLRVLLELEGRTAPLGSGEASRATGAPRRARAIPDRTQSEEPLPLRTPLDGSTPPGAG
jgi:hypothetical protein